MNDQLSLFNAKEDAELFSPQDINVKSPKLKWKLEHHIDAFQITSGEEEGQWLAWQGESGPNNSTNVIGATEIQALFQLANNLKIEFFMNL